MKDTDHVKGEKRQREVSRRRWDYITGESSRLHSI